MSLLKQESPTFCADFGSPLFCIPEIQFVVYYTIPEELSILRYFLFCCCCCFQHNSVQDSKVSSLLWHAGWLSWSRELPKDCVRLIPAKLKFCQGCLHFFHVLLFVNKPTWLHTTLRELSEIGFRNVAMGQVCVSPNLPHCIIIIKTNFSFSLLCWCVAKKFCSTVSLATVLSQLKMQISSWKITRRRDSSHILQI